MKDERFARLRRIVLEMAPLSPDERDAYLRTHDVDERLAAEARKLLDAGEAVSPLLNTDGAAPLAGELLAHDPDSLAGRRVGPYLLERELGRGGMGLVYRATQERPIRREVAIKILRPEIAADSVMRRFAHEKEVLAQLQHPNVARVLDAGVMDERLPYFVLELVEGRSITTYCRQHGLPLRERLKIFTEVCAGVEHAHRRGILHRDLKPSNILVTRDGDDVGVKIIDFGIARLLDASGQELSLLTLEGHALGTPRYMSPEQARGERSRMDVRSDVFALGVVLHELATDDLPYDIATTSVLGILRAVAAADTRLLDRTIDGNSMPSDLGTILAKALDPDPDRRYGSVSALSEDIECFLEHRPIRARPASLGYQLRKAVQRHPVVAALAATLAVVLVGATVALVVLLQEQRTARALAQDAAASAREETRKATLINDFLQRLLASARPTEEGIDVTVREVVDASALSLEEELGDEPAIQAAIRQTLGKTFMELGDYESALNQLDRALETRYQLGDSSSLETAQTLDDLAEVHWKSYAFDDAVGPLERALEIRRTLLSEESAEVAQSLHNLAMTLNGLPHRREEAMELEQRALAIRRRLYDDRHVKIAESLNGIVSILMREKRYHDAVPRAREVVAIRTELLGSDDPSTVRSASNLAVCLTKTGAFEESAAILREILDIQISLLGDEHPDVAMIHYNLGGSFEHQDSLGAAAVEFRRAMEIRRESLGPTSPRTWFALTRLSDVLERSGRREAAIALRDSFTTAAQHAPARAQYLRQNHAALARMSLAEERLEAAEGHLRECVALLRPSDLQINGAIAIVRRLAAQLQEKLDDPERVADLRVAIEEVAGAATE